MQQHPVPQNIMAVEFQLVGSMTVKQFIYVAAAAVLAGMVYASPLYDFIKWPIIVIFALIGLGLAFVPINDLPLDRWIVAFITSVTTPTKRIWRKEPKSLDYLMPTFVTIPKNNNAPVLQSDRTKLDAYLSSVRKEREMSGLEEHEKAFLAKLNFNDTSIQTPISVDTPVQKQVIPQRESVVSEAVHPNKLATPVNNIVAAHHYGDTSTYITKVGNTQTRAINPNMVLAANQKLPVSGVVPQVPQAVIPTPPPSPTINYAPIKVSPTKIAAAPPMDNLNTAWPSQGSQASVQPPQEAPKAPEMPKAPPASLGVPPVTVNPTPEIPQTAAGSLVQAPSAPAPRETNSISSQAMPSSPTQMPSINGTSAANQVQYPMQNIIPMAQTPTNQPMPVASQTPPTLEAHPEVTRLAEEKKSLEQKLAEMQKQIEQMQQAQSQPKLDEVQAPLTIQTPVAPESQKTQQVMPGASPSPTLAPSATTMQWTPQTPTETNPSTRPVAQTTPVVPPPANPIPEITQAPVQSWPTQLQTPAAPNQVPVQKAPTVPPAQTAPAVEMAEPTAEEAPFIPKVIPAEPAIGRMAPPKPFLPNVISGWVKDQQGQLLSDVILVVKDMSGNPVRALKSNKIGKFAIATPLANGTYHIESEKKGYHFDISEVELTGQILSPIEIKTV